MKIETAVHQSLGHLKAVKRRSPATIQAYRADLASFIATLEAGGDAPVEALVPADVNRWMSGMAGRGEIETSPEKPVAIQSYRLWLRPESKWETSGS